MSIQHSLLPVILLASSLVFGSVASVTGSVVDEYGVPVPHMTVAAFPAEVGYDLSLPTTKTDEKGKFALWLMTWRQMPKVKWTVYAYDQSGYYPKMPGGFYPLSASGAVIVEITPDALTAKADLRLGQKAGAVIGKVTESAKGTPLKARVCLALASDPQITLETDSEIGKFRVLVPSNTNVTLHVTSPSHKQWSYPGVINVAPGQEMKLDILMDEATNLQTVP